MTQPVIIRRCTVLSLSASDSQPGARAAFALAQKIATACTTLIVSAPLQEQPAQSAASAKRRSEANELKIGATAAGLETDFKPLSFEETLSELSTVPREEFIILLQPDHPLDRQAPSFQRLSKAALRAPGRTIYSPQQAGEMGEYILVAGSSPSLAKFANTLSQQMALPTNTCALYASLSDLRKSILTLPTSKRPALLVLQDADYEASPSAYMKLAALVNIPVLVL